MEERVNYHCHCLRCKHAVGSEEDYISAALEKGLSKLGMSDHLPFPDADVGARMACEELDEYLDKLTALRDGLDGKLTLYRGFEAEYIRAERPYYEKVLAHEKCDYLLLGQHIYETDGGYENVYVLSDTEKYEAYAHSLVEAMSTGYFRYAAHPDLMFFNDHPWDIHCDRACDIIIEGAVKYGFAVEYNANGMRRGIKAFSDGERYPYPHERFWSKAAEAGVEVYVGSDCHDPAFMYDDAVTKAYENLKRLGFTPKTELF